MLLKDLVRFIPRPLVCGLRAAQILLQKRGQTRRDTEGNCTDANGKPTLWMTYSSIDFLDSYDFSDLPFLSMVAAVLLCVGKKSVKQLYRLSIMPLGLKK